jgi:hypothetical protein
MWISRLTALLCCSVALSPISHAAQCASTPDWLPVIELYTSEGCSSCPPADAWLSTFAQPGGAQRAVALAFHVDYWNSLGWRDPYSSPDHSARQRRLARAEGGSVVYTPQVRIAGADFRGWRSTASVDGALADAGVRRAAPIRIQQTVDGNQLRISAALDLPPSRALYLALYEMHLSSAVTGGENTGRRLTHDFVVRQFIGPFNTGRGATDFAHTLDLPATPAGRRFGIALVQADARSGAALSAAAAPLCGS